MKLHKNKTILWALAVSVFAIPVAAFSINKIVNINNTFADAPDGFTDPNLYSCLRKAIFRDYDTGADITEEQYQNLLGLACNGMNITNLDGIERLTNLETIYFYNNQIVSADLSHNTHLREINIYENPLLTSIKLPAGSTLQLLDAENTNLSSIDLSGNSALSELYIDSDVLVKTNITPTVSGGNYVYDFSNLMFMQKTDGYTIENTSSFTYDGNSMKLTVTNPAGTNGYAQVVYQDGGTTSDSFRM